MLRFLRGLFGGLLDLAGAACHDGAGLFGWLVRTAWEGWTGRSLAAEAAEAREAEAARTARQEAAERDELRQAEQLDATLALIEALCEAKLARSPAVATFVDPEASQAARTQRALARGASRGITPGTGRARPGAARASVAGGD